MAKLTGKKPRAAVEALADAWASIDGKLQAFRAGRNKPLNKEPGGHYTGYICEAEEMIQRLQKRGFTIEELNT